MSELKLCTKCKKEKEVTEFNKDSSKSDGLYSSCKSCKSKQQQKITEEQIIKIKQKTKEYREKNKDKLKQKREKNKDKIKEWNKNWSLKNKEHRKEYMKLWRLKNKNHIGLYNKKYRSSDTDVVKKIKLAKNIRTRINMGFKNNKFIKNAQTVIILGCDFDFLKKYLESKFSEGMNWENYGRNGWHVDHIIPLSSAKNEEEMYRLCHHTNLQPLWAIDNIIKSNKI